MTKEIKYKLEGFVLYSILVLALLVQFSLYAIIGVLISYLCMGEFPPMHL